MAHSTTKLRACLRKASRPWLTALLLASIAWLPSAFAAPAARTKKPSAPATSAASVKPAADPAAEEDGNWKDPPADAGASDSRASDPRPGDPRPSDPELGEPPVPTEDTAGERPSPLTPRPEELPGRPSLQADDYAALLAELVALRARVNALTQALYESKLRISLEADGEDVRIAGLTVTVDGGVVFTAPEKFVGAEEIVVYEHAVAPGRHVIGVEVERFDPRAKNQRSWHMTRYAVDVPEKRTLSTRLELEDDSSMQDPTSGRYRMRSSMRVEVLEP